MSLLFPRSTRPAPAPERRSFASFIGGWATVADGSHADVTVTPESSMQSVAVRASVDLLASLASELPLDTYRAGPERAQQITTPAYLLDPSGDGHGRQDWCYQVMQSWLLHGNVIGRILERSPLGYPTQVELVNFAGVTGQLVDGRVVWFDAGKRIPDAEALHSRVNPVPGRVTGQSPIALHAAKIGLDLMVTRFGVNWFRDGGHPGGLLVNEEADLSETQVATAKQRFLAALRGTREPVVLGKGWRYQQVQIAPEESQFLETHKLSQAECARIFGPGVPEILGYDTGGAMTYQNVDARATHLLVYTLDRWLARLERLLSTMLPSAQFVRFNRDALLRTTTIERYRAHKLALEMSFKTVNEVREHEDLPPVPWGDEPVAPPAAPTAETEDGQNADDAA